MGPQGIHPRPLSPKKIGEEIAVENIRLTLDAVGMRATDANGGDLGSHEAFWFAWSQFYPDTELWKG
ncbi:MAG: hypothetical protein AAF530_00695 [Pseudomonadota bacterium]